MGGLKSLTVNSDKSQQDRNVLMLNTSKEVWYKLKPLEDDGKKVSNVVCA